MEAVLPDHKDLVFEPAAGQLRASKLWECLITVVVSEPQTLALHHFAVSQRNQIYAELERRMEAAKQR